MSHHRPLRDWFSGPLLGLHALAVVAVALCVAGGLWQMGVYEGRQDDERSSAAASLAQAQPLGDQWKAGEAFPTELQQRSVVLQGRFGPATEQLWVQGAETTGGQAWLVAPFLVAGTDDALLVVRGSAAVPGPVPDVPTGEQSVTVVLQPGQGGGSALDARRTTTAVSIPVLLNELPHRLFSGYGLATTDTGADLALVSAPDPDVSWTAGLKNLAYALQWWVFGLFAAFMWWRMCSESIEARRALRDARPLPVA
ncbi:hypothetical protein ASD11_15525 [Aeromicrobium sp. Root495]|uniref:SURF1 family protein n=1 Tax=Aeromicrobium sp. Root495 TaxID=1736550 RepID=UPI0006FF9459|nr:SURF1 family cytochrome oxidase biogenesis protein [Aeromicrobium sp. Root495]KQY55902.1 hypothetical protein ASD11_15525 [Aeromicrobium sp. Root495]